MREFNIYIVSNMFILESILSVSYVWLRLCQNCHVQVNIQNKYFSHLIWHNNCNTSNVEQLKCPKAFKRNFGRDFSLSQMPNKFKNFNI